MSLFLHVKITVDARQEHSFTEQLKIVLREKALGDWKLRGGLRLTEQLDPSRFDGGHGALKSTEVQFVNMWQLPEGATSSDVAATMVRLSETESYVELDAKVVTEVQEIVYLINKPLHDRAWENVIGKGGAFARIRHYPDRSKIGSFVFTIGAAATAWEATKGWIFLGTFQNITGLLNEFWDYWHIPDPDGLAHFEKQLNVLTSAPDQLTKDLVASTQSGPPAENRAGPPGQGAVFHDGLALLAPAEYWRLDR